MKTTMMRLWTEDCAAIIAAEMLLIMSILVIGVIVGLAAVRDSIVTELADVAQAIVNVNQSFRSAASPGITRSRAAAPSTTTPTSAPRCWRRALRLGRSPG